MQKSRFTASKPSIFAIASGEKFIRHLVTSFHQRSLSQSQYQNDPTKPNFGTLTATTYGNGAKVSSRYDDFNRVTGVVYGEETAPRYEYDYNAKGQVARVRDNLLNRTTQSEYDLANRPVRVKTSEDAKHVYTGQVAYDNVYGNLSEFTEKVGENRQEFGTKFGYDDENRPTSLTYSIGATTIGQSTTTIDKLNRTTFSAVKLGSKTFTSEYHFAAGGYGTGSVTNLVSSITQPGCNCGYGYDDNGNIASATLNGKWTGYTYDALGQLIQVNDHSDTRSGENGTTWKYTYDLGGNILKKERFAYNDTTTPLETVTYTYGDANWRDKLTAVNGSTICYDAIGNPLNDGTWTYTWQNSRQLQKMQKAGVTVEFVYNADGLRVQKTVNGVATKYTLHGKNVVHMTSGTDELHFFYDAQNRPTVVVYNGVPYAYVKSLQGDIVAILDENGNMVVSYGYDAWGAPLWCTGELAETLGKVQPFRYRGYVFDEETGLYYLRSRYYNPQWGRFVNADSLIVSENAISQNLFRYCKNSPISRKDTNGARSKGSTDDDDDIPLIDGQFYIFNVVKKTKVADERAKRIATLVCKQKNQVRFYVGECTENGTKFIVTTDNGMGTVEVSNCKVIEQIQSDDGRNLGLAYACFGSSIIGLEYCFDLWPLQNAQNALLQWSQKHPDMPALTADGYLGPDTEKVIREFQCANGLEVDGRIGDATKLELLPYYLEFENCTPP